MKGELIHDDVTYIELEEKFLREPNAPRHLRSYHSQVITYDITP